MNLNWLYVANRKTGERLRRVEEQLIPVVPDQSHVFMDLEASNMTPEETKELQQELTDYVSKRRSRVQSRRTSV